MIRPTRDQAVDSALLVLLASACLAGWGSTFTGGRFLVVGVTGVLVGAAVAHVTAALRWPLALTVVAAGALFLLLGPLLCLSGEGTIAPTPAAWEAMAHQLIHGWKELLTTLPPVDGDGPLLVLPWALGLLTGLLGTLLSRAPVRRSWLRAVLPLPAVLGLLAAVILLGVQTPTSLWLQGVVVAAGSLLWMALRSRRTGTPVVAGSGQVGRLAAGVGLVGVAALAAYPVAAWAVDRPDAGRPDAERVVLRSYVEPPFDVGRYPSPLASFRRYVEDPDPPPSNLFDRVLFTVEGAPARTRVRLATLDEYDGVVWGAANNAFPGVEDDTYRRVGSTLDNPASGDPLDVRVTMGEGWASTVWLPTIGALQGIDFRAADADALAASFRYNLAASAGIVPSGLRPGDTYTFTSVLPDQEVTVEDRPSTQLGPAGSDQPWLDSLVAAWTEEQPTPMAKVFAIADRLRTEGKYSDGVVARERIYRPGHFVARLGDGFLGADIMVGNDEQYAAAMALLANRAGVPARVVLGAVVPDGGVVRGSDVSAWVELRVEDGSWRVLPTEAFMDFDRPADQQTRTQEQLTGMVIPPPAQVPPPSSLGEQNDAETTARTLEREETDEAIANGWPAWLRTVLLYAGGPLMAVLLTVSAVLLAKGVRRRRRRSRGPVSARIGGGWRELVDHARDLGRPVPVVGVTRGEQSLLLASDGAAGLARRADRAVFGPTEPEPEVAHDYWSAVDDERRAMSQEVSRWRRLRAALALRSLRTR